jgi:hypothetical protein
LILKTELACFTRKKSQVQTLHRAPLSISEDVFLDEYEVDMKHPVAIGVRAPGSVESPEGIVRQTARLVRLSDALRRHNQ